MSSIYNQTIKDRDGISLGDQHLAGQRININV